MALSPNAASFVIAHHILRRPFRAVNRPPYGAVAQAQPAACVAHAHRFAKDSDKHRASPVNGLLFAGSPSAIVRRVTARIINSVKRHAFGFSAHVGKKTFERLPPVAHGNSATAVISEFATTWVLASLTDSTPTIPCWRVCKPMSFIGWERAHMTSTTIPAGV